MIFFCLRFPAILYLAVQGFPSLEALKRDLSVRVRGCSCEPNNQLNVLYHVRNLGGVSEVQVVHIKTILSPLPVFHY